MSQAPRTNHFLPPDTAEPKLDLKNTSPRGSTQLTPIFRLSALSLHVHVCFSTYMTFCLDFLVFCAERSIYSKVLHQCYRKKCSYFANGMEHVNAGCICESVNMHKNERSFFKRTFIAASSCCENVLTKCYSLHILSQGQLKRPTSTEDASGLNY